MSDPAAHRSRIALLRATGTSKPGALTEQPEIRPGRRLTGERGGITAIERLPAGPVGQGQRPRQHGRQPRYRAGLDPVSQVRHLASGIVPRHGLQPLEPCHHLADEVLRGHKRSL